MGVVFRFTNVTYQQQHFSITKGLKEFMFFIFSNLKKIIEYQPFEKTKRKLYIRDLTKKPLPT